jgi:hypothetical protein
MVKMLLEVLPVVVVKVVTVEVVVVRICPLEGGQEEICIAQDLGGILQI